MRELTHYERVMRACLPYEREAQAFAQRAYAKEEPERFFFDYLQEERGHALLLGPTGEALKKLLTATNRAMVYLHHLVQETMRRQVSKSSFVEMSNNKAFGKMVCAAVMTSDVAITNVTGHMHYHMAVHRMAGQKVFDMSPGLAEKLRSTELRGLTADDLKLPFPSIYVMVPKEADLQVYNKDSGWHRAVGLYVAEDIDSDNRRCWRFLICGEPKPVEVLKGVVDDNDALVYFHVALPKGLPLTETIARAHEEAFQDVEVAKKHQADGFLQMLDKWQDIFRWAMNVVLYSSMEGAEKEEVVANEDAARLEQAVCGLPKDSKKRHRLYDRLSKMQPLRRTLLGRSVGRPGGWQLTVRVLVTGHWRNQPYGPGHSLRKLIWIEPYWKGRDDDESVANTTPGVAPVASGSGGRQNEPRNGKGVTENGGLRSPIQQGAVRVGDSDEGASTPGSSSNAK